MATLNLQFLGHARIERDGAEVKTDRRKAVALLAYLAVSGLGQPREELAAFFWPDFESERAFAYLRRTLWEINQMIGPGWIHAGRDVIRLERSDGLRLDTQEFERLLEEAHRGSAQATTALEEAARLYRGDFLAGFNLRDSPEFDNWQLNLAEHYRRRLGEALDSLARAYLEAGQTGEAETPAHRYVDLDPLNEAAQRLLMEVFARGGQRSAALHQYERVEKLLNDELGALPEAETAALYQQIRDGEVRQPFGSTAPVSAAPQRPRAGRLPLPATPFIGRKAELAELSYMLGRPECRLVTLYGSGGIGKTRLALQAAQAQSKAFKDGAYFISLATLSDPGQVPAGLADELGIPRYEQIPQAELHRQVIDYLRQRQVLLVMDNFEHLLQAAVLLEEVLAEAPGVKIIATSQERLNLAEEWTFEIGGLSYPLNGLAGDLEEYSSVQLFLHHAQRAQARFHASESDLQSISRICRLMEGLPLGIEMAAAWVRVLSCQEIAAEIEANLDFLETTQQGVPERQRSLRAVFNHSWKLLRPVEQQAFRRLAVFQGGFTRGSAAEVAGVGLPQLSGLVDKSLVHRHMDGRYDLHGMLRQFATEKLAAAPGEQSALREAHRAYYIDLLMQATNDLTGAGQKDALNRLTSEAANVRAAWYRTVAQGSLDELERITLTLMMYFVLRWRPQEGLETFAPALERLRHEHSQDPENPQALRLFVLMLALTGSFLTPLNFDQGSKLVQEGIALAPALANGPVKAYASLLLGFGFGRLPPEQQERWSQETLVTLKQAGDEVGAALAQLVYGGQLENRLQMAAARATYEDALAEFTRLHNRWGMASCDHSLSEMASWLGEFEAASRLAREALEIYEDLEDPWRIMDLNTTLGQALTAQGKYAEARQCFQSAMDFAALMGNRYLVAVDQDCLAYIGYLQGDYATAEGHSRRSLEAYRVIKHPHGMGMALTNLGDCALGRGDLAAARQFYEEGLGVLGGHELLWGKSKCIKMLGWIDLLEGELVRSGQRLSEALALAVKIDRHADALEILEMRAEWHVSNSDAARALALLECLRQQPGLTAEVRRRCDALKNRLAADAVQAGCGQTLAEWIQSET
jgi:predicted ATPase/DNA-binding SARP family transcriptional activator